ncbi:MAG TPA: hypothetical protein VMY87_11860 [Armatimonadota bacterium]|nr:hypothetical protein [Armatimonadota bacterium]
MPRVFPQIGSSSKGGSVFDADYPPKWVIIARRLTQGRLERAIAGCDREVETLLGKLAREVVSDEDYQLQRGRLRADKDAWQERLAEIEPLIADAELSARAADAVADTLGGVNFEELDLRERRWLLTQLDFTMTLACEDWRAKSSQRRYEITIRWAGQALLGEQVTRDYVGSSKEAGTISRVARSDPAHRISTS